LGQVGRLFFCSDPRYPPAWQTLSMGGTVAQRVVGIIMNGVTGRMGMNQHLIRSILALREQGGLPIGDGDVIWPEPLLVGRSEAKLAALAGAHGLQKWSTDLDAA